MYQLLGLTPHEPSLSRRRLQTSPHRSISHPAPGERRKFPKLEPPLTPCTVLKRLFDDVVRRELKVDPSETNSHITCQTNLARDCPVESRPSLSSPELFTALQTPCDVNTLRKIPVLRRITRRPLEQVICLPSAEAAHQILTLRRIERAEREAYTSIAAEDSTDTVPASSAAFSVKGNEVLHNLRTSVRHSSVDGSVSLPISASRPTTTVSTSNPTSEISSVPGQAENPLSEATNSDNES